MSALESSQDKVQQLCELLQTQAIEPAHKQARDIIDQAQKQAQEILQQAKSQASKLLDQTQEQIKREKEVLETALKQASHQAVNLLRQELEGELLGSRIHQLCHDVLSQSELLVGLIKAYIEAVQREGLKAEFSVLISRHENGEKLAQALGADVVASLREGKLLQVLPEAGVKLQLHGRHLSVDCSESTLSDLLAQFLRRDLRERLFASN